MTEKKSIWEAAGRAGLILGCVPIAYMLISMLVEKIPTGALTALLSFVLWAAKFIMCIYIVRMFLKAYSKNVPEAGHDEVFKFGVATTLLSSLIFAAFYLAYVLFIQPDIFTNVIETIKESPLIDPNDQSIQESLKMMESILPRMPRISFFTQLIYGSLWGVILSAIFSRNIPAENPFKDDANEKAEQ